MADSIDRTDREPPLPGTTPAHWLLLAATAGLVILADQLSKRVVVDQLALGESWEPAAWLAPVFRITHVHNTGAAFGMFPEGGTFFLIVAAIVSVVILLYYRQLPRGAWAVRLALGLQLGGALGNVVDRVRLGYVVDFLHVEHIPVFNVADSCIVVGAVLLALVLLYEEWQLGRQPGDGAPGREGAEENTLARCD